MMPIIGDNDSYHFSRKISHIKKKAVSIRESYLDFIKMISLLSNPMHKNGR